MLLRSIGVGRVALPRHLALLITDLYPRSPNYPNFNVLLECTFHSRAAASGWYEHLDEGRRSASICQRKTAGIYTPISKLPEEVGER